MIKSLVALATLVTLSSTAAAATTTCLRSSGMTLRDTRVTYQDWFTVYELQTDGTGCVEIPTWGTGPATITVHATNRVVQMVDWGFAVAETRTVDNNSTHLLPVDFAVAERMQRDYDNGLRGFGPFGASPLGGSVAQGPYVSADLGSPIVVSLPYVEPAPGGLFLPRIHLRSTDTSGTTPHHELAHALQMAHWPLWLRLDLEATYVGWLLGPDNSHSFDEPSTEVVAYIEAFGEVGSTFEAISGAGEVAFLAQASSRTAELRSERSGDDTIEGVVFGILFHEFAETQGLDYVIDTVISCEVLTLQDYAECIHDREGRNSAEFGALRVAGDVYGVAFDVAPMSGDADFCTNGFRCEREEGDCDSDAHCADGLECLHNRGDSYGLPANYDVCELPNGHANRCNGLADCDIGEGDCDSDAQCESGLVCIHNVGSAYGWSGATDVCELPEGASNKCTPAHPCNRDGSGDCDTDADCTTGLYCTQNTGAQYGLPSWVDTCEAFEIQIGIPGF